MRQVHLLNLTMQPLTNRASWNCCNIQVAESHAESTQDTYFVVATGRRRRWTGRSLQHLAPVNFFCLPRGWLRIGKRSSEPSTVAHWISHQMNFSSTYSSSPRAPTHSSCPQPVAVTKVVSLPSAHRIITAIKSSGAEDRPPGLRHQVMGATQTHWVICLTMRADSHIACAHQACLSRFSCRDCNAPGPPPRQKNCRVKSCCGGGH